MLWDSLLRWVQASPGQALALLLLITGALIAQAAWVALSLVKTGRRLRALFPAGQTSLEDLVLSLARSVEEVSGRTEDAMRKAESVALHLSHSPRHLGVVRFNAFQGTGSNLSFALAVLDDHGSGLVLSSISGREESRMYVKPVHEGSSAHQLTEEERQAIRNARRQYVVQEGIGGGMAKRSH